MKLNFRKTEQKTKNLVMWRRVKRISFVLGEGFIKGKDLMYTCVSYVFKIAKSVNDKGYVS